MMLSRTSGRIASSIRRGLRPGFGALHQLLGRCPELPHQRGDVPAEALRHGPSRLDTLWVFPRHFLHLGGLVRSSLLQRQEQGETFHSF